MRKTWSLGEVRGHKSWREGFWIAVDNRVYDITGHLVDHPAWETGTQISTIISIMAHSGSECSSEFNEIHRPYPIAFKQLQAYYIGDLRIEGGQEDLK